MSAEEWMVLAEEDFEVAVHLFNLGKFRPSLFHLQQSVEKYLKAFPVLKGIEFERTHDIEGSSSFVLKQTRNSPTS